MRLPRIRWRGSGPRLKRFSLKCRPSISKQCKRSKSALPSVRRSSAHAMTPFRCGGSLVSKIPRLSGIWTARTSPHSRAASRRPTMTLDEVLDGLFPSGHDVKANAAGIIIGTGKRKQGEAIAVIGVANGEALGTAGVLPLAQEVLRVVAKSGNTPILVLVDTQGQLMARRDEMRGLNEYLAHLAKCLLLASQQGHRTIGLEYGKAAAGAFLATALATDCLVGLPGAEPTVMDLPSMSRVTKLPLDTLKELAKTTAVFAPGLDQLAQMGAVAEIWDPAKPLDEQLEATLKKASPVDTRDELGAERKGRPMAARVAKQVIAEATGRGDHVAAA